MGIRITLFALDLDQFTTFVQQNVWDWLWFYVENGSDQDSAFRIDIDGIACATFLATPKKGVVAIEGKKKVSLDRANRPAGSPFSSSLRDYLGCNSVWKLKQLLDALSKCPANKVARLVTSGYRRWWIGSLLDHAEHTLGSSASDYVYLASLFQRILRGYDCGHPLPKDEDNTADVCFPIVLPDDSDLRMSMWTDEETWFVIETIRSIISENTTFSNPMVGFPPPTDEEWNEFVRRMTTHLLAVEEFPVTMRTIVGFIC